MVIGLLSDLHIKQHKKSEKFLPHVIKAISFFEEECERRKVEKVFILGDVFHVKDTIAVYAQNAALKSFRRIMKKWPTHMIPGNHDILSKADASINGLSIFADSCNLYESYGSFAENGIRFHFIPYLNDIALREVISSIKLDKDEKNILCSHLGLRGFILENNHEDIYSDLTTNDIDIGWDRIFSGHYHSHQTKGKVTYISSPYESHYGDEGNHGFCFYDTETDVLEFVPNNLSPRFVTIELKASNMDIVNSLSNCFIKLIIKKNIDTSLLIKYREKLLKKNFDVVFDFNIASSTAKLNIAKGWEEFISESPEDILISYVKDNSHEKFSSKELLSYIGVS